MAIWGMEMGTLYDVVLKIWKPMPNHKIKRLPLLLILLLSLPQISYAIQFGAGTGTSYPTSLDTSFPLTNKSGGACVQSASSSKACSETINDIQSAVISLQTSLGIGSLYSTAHTWTANQTISNTAPSLIFTDTTASAKSLTIAVDANIVDLRESAGASGSLMVLDLANNRMGIGTAAPEEALTVVGALKLTPSPAPSDRDKWRFLTSDTGSAGLLELQDFSGGSYTTNVSFLSTGLVGIGTTNPGALLDIGLAGTTLGVARFAGNTSGNVTIQPAAAAGTWTFTLPTTGGTANYPLTTNGSGVSSWAQLSLTAGVTGILPTANGGTGIAYFTAAGPTAARIYTFPDAAATVLTTNAVVTAAQGGTGIANGASSTLTLPNAATTISTGGTIALGGFTLTVPATDTVAMLGVANVFTANQTVSSTAPSVILTDTTASAKSLTVAVDANLANLRESAGASGSLMALDLANNRVGIGTATPYVPLTIYGTSASGPGFQIRTENSAASSSGGFTFVLSSDDIYINQRQAKDMYFYTNNAFAMVIKSGGNVGIGQTGPSTLFELLGADNTTVQTIKINATQANITAADVFMDFRSTTGSEATIAGTAVAGVIAYNTFTGSHYTQIDDRDGLEVGMLLEAVGDKTGEWAEKVVDELIPEKRSKNDKGEDVVEPARIEQHRYKASSKPHLVKSRISKTKGTQAAYGVYGGTDKEGRDMVFALGSGPCMVAKSGKDLKIGDYLVASDVPGAMAVQADDIYRSSTVAKVMEPVTWAQGEVVRSGVACIYLGG